MISESLFINGHFLHSIVIKFQIASNEFEIL